MYLLLFFGPYNQETPKDMPTSKDMLVGIIIPYCTDGLGFYLHVPMISHVCRDYIFCSSVLFTFVEKQNGMFAFFFFFGRDLAHSQVTLATTCLCWSSSESESSRSNFFLTKQL